MSNRELPSPEVLRQLLRYEPETGKLFWLPRGAEFFPSEGAAKSWNGRRANTPAFTAIDTRGYHHGFLLKRCRLAHRVIWAHVYGEWPESQIDHISGIRTDNRLDNLRQATRHQNACNRQKYRVSTSQFIGLTWRAKTSKWLVQINTKGRKIHIGCFNDEEEAARAYDAAAKVHHGAFARLNFPS